MKKVLTIAIVALLATATLFAGVNFSGRFRQGYTFTFAEDKDPVGAAWKAYEAKLILKIADDNGVWEVNVKNDGDGKATLDSNDKWGANATVDFTKALELAGIDTGDFSVKLSIGANSKMTALSAYTDPTGNEYFKLKNNGSNSTQVALAYGKLAQVNLAFDPTNAGGSMVVSAKTEPIDGIAVAAAYAHKGWIQDSLTKQMNAYDTEVAIAKNVFGFSADINVAKLVGLDFKLGVSAYDNVVVEPFDTKDVTYNSFAAAVYGGVDMIDGFVEFTMANATVKDNDEDSENLFGLNMQVNLNIVENLGLDVYYNIANIEEAGDFFSIGGDVSYTLAGVELALNAEYAKAGDKTGAFSLTPKMIIVF